MKAVMLDHVSKTYADGKNALDSLSLCLEPGEYLDFPFLWCRLWA